MATATRTVMFTDLANYTASVSRADREALRDLLRSHEALVIPVIRRHDGRVIKNLGDSFMALFDAATDAMRAATDLLEVAGTQGLSIRIGAATGDVEEIDGDAFGEAVNLASRIINKTPSDEIRFSESTLQCMKQAEIPWERVGLFALKGFPGEVPVYRAVPRNRAYLPDALVPMAKEGSLNVIRRGDAIPPLPPDPTLVLIGYEPDSEDLRDLLANLPVLDASRLWLVVYTIAPEDRHKWSVEAGHGLMVGQPDVVEEVITTQRRMVTHDPSSDTIILDAGSLAVLELMVVGLALPEVPMSDVVAGYSYDLLLDGRWVNRSEAASLRIDVSAEGTTLIPMSTRVLVDGRPLTRDQVLLTDGTEIEAGDRRYTFRAMKNTLAGLLLSETPVRMLIGDNQKAELGREPNSPGLALADRRGQQNIRWCAGPRAARARESGFTIDRALAGRHQTAITSRGGIIEVEALHERCPTYLWRASGSLERVVGTTRAAVGDHIISGTSVIALRQPDSF